MFPEYGAVTHGYSHLYKDLFLQGTIDSSLLFTWLLRVAVGVSDHQKCTFPVYYIPMTLYEKFLDIYISYTMAS